VLIAAPAISFIDLGCLNDRHGLTRRALHRRRPTMAQGAAYALVVVLNIVSPARSGG